MPSCNRNIQLRHTLADKKLPSLYITLCDSIIIPVFCNCMIALTGLLAGLRHAIFMQFDQDADTEYISVLSAVQYQQLLDAKGSSNFK